MTFRRKDNIEKIVALTDIQAGMLAHALRGGTDPYHTQKALEFEGPLDVAALRRAWCDVVAKHAILRTDFRWNGLKSPVQVVYRNAADDEAAAFVAEDWRELDTASQRRRLADEWRAAHARGFNFERAANLDLRLIRVGEARHWLVWRLHHVQLDGWSLATVLAACIEAYDQHRGGDAAHAVQAPEPPFYRYVEWLQKQSLDDAAFRTAFAPLLAHDAWPTPLPARSQARSPDRASEQGSARAECAEQTIVLDAGHSAALERFARERRVTLNTLLQAAWAWLLSRHALTREVCFGVTVSGRPADLPGVSRMAGMFVNTLPLALRVPPQASIGEWLEQVQQANLDLRPFEHVPLATLRGRAGINADATLFDSIVVFENFPQQLDTLARADGLAIRRLADENEPPDADSEVETEIDAEAQACGAVLGSGRNHYPLSLIAVPGETLRLVLAYRRAHFAHRDVKRLGETLFAVLKVFAARPQVRLGDFSLAEVDASVTCESSSAEAFESLLAVVAARAADAAQCGAIACVEAGEEGDDGGSCALTWGQLWTSAGALAQRLRMYSIRAETPVAVALPRCVTLVASVLGCWRAGAVYVPLDLATPDARLAWQLRHSGARCLICDASEAQRLAPLAAQANCEIVVFDACADADSDAAHREGLADDAPLPDQAAYTIYTSGSTGEPKGVTVSHGALSTYANAVLRRLPDGIASAAYVSTPAADLGHTMLFGALAAGWRLHLFDDSDVRDPDRFAAAMARHDIDALKIVPGHLAGLLHATDAARTLPRRALVLGGESAGSALLARVAELAPACAVLNHYGPTETTVGVLTYRLSDDTSGTPPLGHALDGARVYLLDADGNAAMPGASGELCVGGATLARGYRGQPGASAERFVPDPHGAPGARLYRTGDRAHRRADGALVFEGRLDQQVKVRGYRVEPAEIAACLRALVGVAEAVVLTQADSQGALQLRAFACALNDGAALDARALQAALAAQLPAHMVPASVTVLARLPVTPNGKLDRAALLALAQPNADGCSSGVAEANVVATRTTVAPRNDAEATLLAVWQRVLRRDDIGVTDHFLEIGGDSILSLQVIAQARRAGLRFTPKQMFDHPVIERLAALAATASASASAQQLAAASSAHVPFDLTPIQRSFFARFPQAQHHWNQAVLLTVPPTLDETALRAALDAMVGAHEALRLRFACHADGWRQQVGACEACPLDVFDWRTGAPSSDADAALEQAATRVQRSLDIERGPLLRAAWFRRPQGDRLLLAIHHLAVDGVSWRVLLDDFQHAYAQVRSGAAISLAAGMAWSAWAHSLTQRAQRDDVKREAAWWRASLTGACASLHGIDAIGANAATVGSARVLESAFDADLTRTLLERAGAAYRNNVEETLLAALAHAIDERGVLLSLESHGRETAGEGSVDLSRAVGWFTARFPFWLDAQPDLRRALIDVKARRRAVPHQGTHWGLLEHSSDEAVRAALMDLPAPCVSFNYLGRFDERIGAPNGAGDGFALATESAGELTDHAARLAFALDVNARVVGGKLSVTWRCEPQAEAATQALKARFERSLAQLIEHASQAQPELTAADFPLSGLQQGAFEALDLDLANLEDIYPATPVQQGLLFHSALESGSGLYVNQRRLTLRGDLDRASLRGAWAHVVATHAILRTQFETRHGGDALQIVLRDVDLPFVELDWTALESQVYEAQLQQWMREDLQRGFDVERAPLLRIEIFARADGVLDLVWNDHHVLLDGWSSAQLMREVADAYEALRARREPQSVAPPYRDYVQWRLQQDEGEAWWREQGERIDEPATLLEALGLNTGRALETAHADDAPLEFRLDAELSEALRDTARRHRVTLNTVLQGAWALLLARYGNRSQAAFGVTVSGRPAHLAQVENMLGLFINSLPVWIDVPGDARLSAWLEALQQHNGALRQYEHTPLSRIQQWTARSGDGLFDSLLVFENYPVDAALQGTGLTLDAIESAGRAHYPLTLVVLPERETTLIWKYDATRIDAARVDRLHEHFAGLLGRLTQQQGDPLLRTLTLDVAPTASGEARAGEGVLLARIGEHARTRGDATAIVCEGHALSWRALWNRAGTLAHRLIDAGLRADAPVAVALPRSLDLAVALVAVWRAGGVYLPLDVAAPSARLRAQLDDSGARHLITATPPQGEADVPRTSDVIRLDASTPDDDVPRSFPADAAQPHRARPAYVIYTSGSTGVPKGVVVGHGAMTAYVEAILARMPQSVASAAYVSTPAADLGHTTLLGALWAGWTLHMIDDARATDPDAFAAYMTQHRIDVLKIVPSHLSALMRGAATDVLPRRCLVLGGEAAQRALVAQLRVLTRTHDGFTLLNHYGPTETTVGVLAHEASNVSSALNVAVHDDLPLGAPLAHARVQLVDRFGEPTPEGCAGELLIGGPALALGYLGRPGQTAERFVPDPHGAPGARAYRSGDRMRRDASGVFAFAGRIDDQVKIRGFRVEPAEVRAQLLAHPWIADAAVVVEHSGADADARLVVCAVLHADIADVPETPWPVLREWLSARVSAHLVPAAFVRVTALPLTRNGKLDRVALVRLAATAGATAHRAAPLAPRTPTEALVLDVWREVLEADAGENPLAPFGVRDDFLELGGHSLLAVRIATRLTARLGRKVALADVLRHRTIERVAAALDAPAVDADASANTASAQARRTARVDALNDLFETLD
ncbi:amino acid adenylation protein [Caballeronia sordidicola]|uniref:Amino acid adenylation protein n=1 Tax=Caballeronia sordidicola TaxID=196367 RepID=A0A158HM92_CABSO|nr:non-ribosomal peptide synthetase [Caballeronia sordidicola]SAL45217.1 amino acid adenylation protein [Caballeronia sordidicola]